MILSILGKAITEPVTQTFLSQFKEEPKKEIFEKDTYLDFMESGFALILNDEHIITTIQIYSGNKDDFSTYKKPLPFEISFDEIRKSAQKKLGSPDRSGGRKNLPSLGMSLPWDLFHKDGYDLHLEYAEDERSIILVSLMLPEVTPN